MRSITIQTTQNVSIEYELAGALTRVLAFLIDMLLVFATYTIFTLIFLIDSDVNPTVAFFFLPLLVFILYYYFTEMLLQGQTIGKRVQQIRVLRADGKDPTPGDFLMRALFLLPDAWFSFAIPGILLMNTTPSAQRLGDLVAGTVVVKNKSSRNFVLKDIQSIKTTDNHTPQFPAVQRFSEADMLLIKSSLKRLFEYDNPAHKKAIKKLAEHCRFKLEVENDGLTDVEFLKTLLMDYIVLTR